jgi:hypothetical protein
MYKKCRRRENFVEKRYISWERRVVVEMATEEDASIWRH